VSDHGPEAWLRGPVEGVPPLLQPAAHAGQVVTTCKILAARRTADT
jgi:hypothetical protein